MKPEWAGKVRNWTKKLPASLPIRSFLVALVLAAFLPVYIGSADPWWRVKEWAVLMVGMGWIALRQVWNLRHSRSGQDKFLGFLVLGLLIHFFLLYIFPIIKAPSKLYQVPWPWMAMFHAMIALFWLTDLRRTLKRADIDFLVRVLAFLGAFLGIYMTLQAFNLDPLIWHMKRTMPKFQWLDENHVIGLMGNPFHAAACLAVLIPAIAVQKAKAWKFALIPALYALWATQSLPSFIAGVLGALCSTRLLKTKKHWLYLALIAALVILALSFFKPTALEDHGRAEIWHQAAHHIAKHPILGVGLSQFKLLNIRLIPNNFYDVRWAHNEWVHFATELGILWTCFLASYLTREALKLHRTHRVLFGCFMATLCLSIFHIPFHLAPTLVVMGLCLAASHLEPEKELRLDLQRN